MISNPQLIQFLHQELAISPTEIEVLRHHPELDYAPLPMLLWQYGLISLNQLAQIFDWLEIHNAPPPTLFVALDSI
jgi:Protein of unknown function (DUF2949)